MATKKFRENLISLIKILKDSDELCKFLIEKNAFSDKFIQLITESEQLNHYKGIDEKFSFDINDLKNKLNYEIEYDPDKKNKIIVDITKNDIFSYTDTEEELIDKMDKYIRYEDYEKAEVLYKYLKTLEIEYKYDR